MKSSYASSPTWKTPVTRGIQSSARAPLPCSELRLPEHRMERRERSQDLRVEALETDVVMPAPFRVNCGSQGVGVGKLETSTNPDRGCASCESQIDLNRLDAEAGEHRVDSLGAGAARVA